MSAPAVSVVIPAYNAAAFIEKTLETVAAQTYRDFEVVVVDDGSTDGTHRVVETCLSGHGLPGRVLRQANKKIAGARNAGIAASAGDYIALLDHDDLWLPEKLAVVMAEFARHPEADLVCHDEEVVEDGRLVRITANGPAAPRMYERLLFGGNALSPSAAVFRREKALSVGGFREDPEFNTVEDYDFWMRLARAARFRFIPRVLGRYQLVERRASRSIVYHHTNLENLLNEHFQRLFGPRPGLTARFKMNRRLAAVYRSALGQLMAYSESPQAQREYAMKMMSAFPLDPKNAARALLWLAKTWTA